MLNENNSGSSQISAGKLGGKCMIPIGSPSGDGVCDDDLLCDNTSNICYVPAAPVAPVKVRKNSNVVIIVIGSVVIVGIITFLIIFFTKTHWKRR